MKSSYKTFGLSVGTTLLLSACATVPGGLVPHNDHDSEQAQATHCKHRQLHAQQRQVITQTTLAAVPQAVHATVKPTPSKTRVQNSVLGLNVLPQAAGKSHTLRTRHHALSHQATTLAKQTTLSKPVTPTTTAVVPSHKMTTKIQTATAKAKTTAFAPSHKKTTATQTAKANTTTVRQQATHVVHFTDGTDHDAPAIAAAATVNTGKMIAIHDPDGIPLPPAAPQSYSKKAQTSQTAQDSYSHTDYSTASANTQVNGNDQPFTQASIQLPGNDGKRPERSIHEQLSLQAKFSSDETYIQRLSKSTYTIQVLSARYPETIENFINKHQLLSLKPLRYQDGGKINLWYKLAYGHFNTKQEALKALENLPRSLQQNRPFIRRLANVQKEIEVAKKS